MGRAFLQGCAERAGAKLGFYEEQDWWCGRGGGGTGTVRAGGTEDSYDLSTLLLCQARPLLSTHQVTGQLQVPALLGVPLQLLPVERQPEQGEYGAGRRESPGLNRQLAA